MDYDIHIGDALSAAVGLTSQKSGQAVSDFMLQWMTSWNFVEVCSIFEIYDVEQQLPNKSEDLCFRRIGYEIGEQRVQNEERGLYECVTKYKQVETSLDGGLSRILFPVKSPAGPMRVVVIDGKEFSPQERFLCLHLVQLYENQINVYDEKERDSLTGLLNRQTFDETLISLSTSSDTETSSYLAILDIDHFKRVNDTYGHLYGDEVLLKFSQLMKSNFRYSDYLFRFGGEEFIVLLNDNNLEGALEALERYRQMVEHYDFPVVGNVTVSIGFVHVEPSIMPTRLVDFADKALYYAKDHGRNQTIHYDDIKTDDDVQQTEDDIELF